MTLDISSTELGTDAWAVFIAEAASDSDVALDAEHDRFLWATVDEAVAKCLPDHVGASLRYAANVLDNREDR